MKNPVASILGLLFLLALAMTPVSIWGPQLYRDRLADHRWSIAPNFEVQSARCRRYFFLVSSCVIKFINSREPDRIQRELDYFVFGSWGKESFTMLQATDDPSHISISIAEEHLLNRLITMAVWLLVTLGLFVRSSLKVIKRFRAEQARDDDIDAIVQNHGQNASNAGERLKEPTF